MNWLSTTIGSTCSSSNDCLQLVNVVMFSATPSSTPSSPVLGSGSFLWCCVIRLHTTKKSLSLSRRPSHSLTHRIFLSLTMRSIAYSLLARTCRRIGTRAALLSSVAAPRAHLLIPRHSRALVVQKRSMTATVDFLVDKLSREYDEEMENNTTSMPEDLKKLYKIVEGRGWKIVEEGAMTRLFSTTGPRKVQISFHCQDVTEEEEEETPEEEEPEEESTPGFRFTVTVSKAGKSMVFICISKNAECFIENLTVTSTDVSELDNFVPAKEYQGPEFHELNSDLQDAYDVFLKAEIGIDEEMNAFISMFSDYKEQLQYVDFLESSKKLLS